MASLLPSDMSHHGTYQCNSYTHSHEKVEDGARWYFTRKEIEENSPSKQVGIDLKKETYLRKSYCTFLQDLGMRLKVPQVTIATAIIFCHRFFLRQSHAKNDRRTIATVCMFLAGKVEETPRPLKDVILISYEIMNKKDPAASQRIKQKEVYEQQKELVLIGERVVLGTLGFDLNVHHPYKPLVEAIKKFKVAQNALAQVAWNFVNDGLRTSLCLQFKPHHIAAGAIFLAAKFLKVKLPSDGEKVWWQEFDVTPRQLEEVSNQMLELYEQNREPPFGDVEGSAGGSTTQRNSSKALTYNDENTTTNSNSQVGGKIIRHESRGVSSRPAVEASASNHDGHPATVHSRSSDFATSEMRHKTEDDFKGNKQSTIDQSAHQGNLHDTVDTIGFQSGISESQESIFRRSESLEGETKDRHFGQNHDHKECAFSRPPPEGIKKIDRDKVKAALEKRKKASSQVTRKAEMLNEDDLIERELEDGIELAAESERNKQDRRQSKCMSSEKLDYDYSYHGGHEGRGLAKQNQLLKGQSSHGPDLSTVEEGEVSMVDDVELGNQSTKSSNRKRKATSSPDRVIDGTHHHGYVSGSQNSNRVDYMEDRSKVGRFGHTERDNKRHVQENRI